jgi:hypothetical protein
MTMAGLSGARRAERVDPQSGVREIVEFVGDSLPMLRFLHVPRGTALGTVVICSSVYAEFMKNYRREVRLARSLAASGFVAVRLQYRGTGNSAGDPESATMAALVNDIAEAISDLDSPPDPAYAGTRIGAALAALAAPPSAPLALWEPVLSGEKWLKEGIRAATISKVSRHRGAGEGDSASPLDRLEREGMLDLLGFALYRRLVADIRRIKLEPLLAQRSGPVLIVQIGGGDPKPAFTHLTESLVVDGVAVDHKVVGRDVAWWFEDGGTRDFETDDDVIGATVNWLKQVIPRS